MIGGGGGGGTQVGGFSFSRTLYIYYLLPDQQWIGFRVLSQYFIHIEYFNFIINIILLTYLNNFLFYKY